MTKGLTINLVLSGIIAVFVLMLFRCDRLPGGWQRIGVGDLIVPADSISRWDSLLKLRPIIVYDTIYKDTIHYQIIYKDRPVPVAQGDSLYYLQDSLITVRFVASHSVFMLIRSGMDSVISSRWGYKALGPIEVIKTVTQFVPKPVPYKVEIPASGLFVGGIVTGGKYSFSLGASGSYIHEKWSYDLGTGYQYIPGQQTGGVYFSAGLKHKF